MSIFEMMTTIIVLTALFSYFNYRTLRLPTTIGVMIFSLGLSLLLLLLDHLGLKIGSQVQHLVIGIDFNETFLHGMLAFLLFAGALQVNLGDLAGQKWIITSLATVGVLLSTFIIGGLTWVILGLLGMPVPWLSCLLFGALISPTDPVAVLGMMKTANAPKSLETKIVGESLFNDGVGVVIFMILLALAKGGGEITPTEVLKLFVEEAIGGAIFGLIIGYLVYRLLKQVDNYQVEILLTLALVMGGYVLAHKLHTSGPIAIVVAGLLIGNHGRSFAMSQRTREHIDTFWELVDQILNAVLFVMIGFELLVMTFTRQYLLAGLLLIPVVLLARLISVGGMVTLMRARRSFSHGVVRIMVWSGLRGGISVALALSLPRGPERATLLTITYIVVLFTIIVQGLSLETVIRRTLTGKRSPEI
jgi:monovalent cation:H+ antiporter, CPA1 family